MWEDLLKQQGGTGKLGGIAFDGNGGAARDQVKNVIRRNGASIGDDDDDANPPPGSGFWGEDMPGPPELVNPAPEQKPLRRVSSRGELW